MSQMLKSSGAMGMATLTSRILGMVREMVYANFMGDGPVASAFKLAFQIPNLFRRLLGEGALSAAFIPIFKDKEKNAGEAEMWRTANAVISGLILAASAVIVVALIGLTLVLVLSNPHPPDPAVLKAAGMTAPPPDATVWRLFPFFDPSTLLMLHLLRLMFPYMLLVCLAAVFMGMLNARGHFFVPAMSATTLNLVMIASVLLLAPRFGQTLETQIYALAVGVLVAGLAQAGFQYPTLRRDGYRWQWVSPWGNADVQQVVKKMVPGMLGVAAFQINVLVTNSMGFWVDKTIVASFDYAVRLMELPQGVFGISLATYLLPALSGLAAEKKYLEFRSQLTDGLGFLLFANLIASILLTILSEPIIRLIFEHGQFDLTSTARAAKALSFLAPGLVLFSVVNVLARAFYALGDTRTPMLISVVCLTLNLIFVFWLISPLRQAGLGLANTMSAAFNVWLLAHALKRKLPKLDFAPITSTLLRMLIVGATAGAVAWLSLRAWDRYLGHRQLLARLGEVFVPMTLASLTYGGMSLWLKIPQADVILNMLRGKSSAIELAE
jgi:putative peptidoglycan lipid II flippase